jgi:predicted peroxiredoxin
LIRNVTVSGGGKAYVERESCDKRGIKETELLQEIDVVGRENAAQILLEADGSIIF